MAILTKLLAMGVFMVTATSEEVTQAVAMDDECADGHCALNALQLQGNAESADQDSELNETTAELDPEGDQLGVVSAWGGWAQGGDKMWGRGRGVEDINGGNVGYYNAGMDAAHGRCGGSGCALIVNPMHHRSIEQFHIHFVHYGGGYGANLKHRLEKRVCGSGGWHGGGLPCHGKAIFVSGWPRVFSVAMGGGGLTHASVIAWPGACGGSGTIIELAYHCSIEHQIRGDFNPALR